MKILMVGPYAPSRDGIAAYTVAEVRAARADGHDVTVVSPLPSAAHQFLPLGNANGFRRLAALAAGMDRVIIQVFPELLFGRVRHGTERTAVWAAIARLARRVPLELRVHEFDPAGVRSHDLERRAAAAAMGAVDRITVHTRTERDDLVDALGLRSGAVELIDHGAHFRANVDTTRGEARAELGVDGDAHVFLSIGFLQAHKGFDRAIAAFGLLGGVDAELHVVGDVRIDHPDLEAHARSLERMAAANPRVTLHRGYVGDADFDRWIIAADTVVLPYREIWSSGVIERARILDRPVIASDVGGLADQHHDALTLVADDAELRTAMAAAAGATLGGSVRAGDRAEPLLDLSTLQGRIDRTGLDLPTVDRDVDAVEPLVQVGSLRSPRYTSALPGVAALKKVVAKATNFQTLPLVGQLNALRDATIESILDLEARVEALESGGASGAPGDDPPVHTP